MEEGQPFGPYQLLKRIAYGGMAEIHLAKTSGVRGFEKLLALKVIHPKFSADQEFIDMLVDEAKIAVQLGHVNIGQIFDLGRIEDTYYISMEFIDGKDLYQLLVKCSELEIDIPFDIIVFIAMELAAGLQYAHTKADNYGRPLNIVHRDISPQNVLISYDGEIKIVDFGIAKASQRSKETESGVIKGKFFYMSPEQAWGDPIDARTDIFSSGICLYEMITGEMLYNEDKALALLDKVRKAEIPPMRQKRSDLPPALEGIVLKALARDRQRRYQTAGDLHRALSAFLYSNWPDFNRNRVKDFMRRVFGDQRFVLPLPAVGSGGPQLSIERQDRTPAVAPINFTADRMMAAGDVDPVAGKSVIFDLNQVAQVRGGLAPVDDDDEDPTISATPYADPDEDERTIAEVVWDPDNLPKIPAPQAPVQLARPPLEPDDGEDETAVIDMSAVDAARALAETPAVMDTEPPTALFMRDKSMAMPQRAHRPKAPTAGSNVPTDPRNRTMAAAAALPSGPPPGLPPMPPGPLPAAPKPLERPPAPKPALKPVASKPPTLRPPTPTPAPSMDAFKPPEPGAAKPRKAKPRKPQKPNKPRKRNRADEKDRPTMHVMPPRKKTGLARLTTPAGLSAIGILALLVVGAFLVLPALKKGENAKPLALVVTSVPANAKVILDGQPQDQATPTRIEGMVAGTKHTLRVEVKGFEPHEESFTVAPAESGEIKRRVFLKKLMGKLDLTSVPPGAEVYMDGKYLGDTPLPTQRLDRDKNEIMLILRKDGFNDEKVVLTWGEQVELDHKVTLRPRKK